MSGWNNCPAIIIKKNKTHFKWIIHFSIINFTLKYSCFLFFKILMKKYPCLYFSCKENLLMYRVEAFLANSKKKFFRIIWKQHEYKKNVSKYLSHVLKTRFLKYFHYYYGHTYLLLTQCLCFYRYCPLIALACHNHSMSKHIMWCVPSTSVLLTSGHYNLLSVFGRSDANSSMFQVAIVIHYFRFPSHNHYWCRKLFLIQKV